MRVRVFTVVTAWLVMLALVAGPAHAVTTTFDVSPLGTYLSPTTASIRGTVTCDAGPWTLTFTKVSGTPYDVSGEVVGVCDGTRQPWEALIVGGPWAQGQAIVFRATLVTSTGTVFKVPKVVLR